MMKTLEKERQKKKGQESKTEWPLSDHKRHLKIIFHLTRRRNIFQFYALFQEVEQFVITVDWQRNLSVLVTPEEGDLKEIPDRESVGYFSRALKTVRDSVGYLLRRHGT